MKLNVAQQRFTHEGAKASIVSPYYELRRTIMSCMLWEDNFYEDGKSIADRIGDLVKRCKPYEVSELAIEARNKQHLRHVPLLLARHLATVKETGSLVSNTLFEIIQRPDELAEFLAIYWKDKRQPLSSQVKKGLAKAFTKFSAYQLGKYNRDGSIKLRDVLFLCHAKPKDEEQAAVWKKLVAGTLESPDTWEVALSGGAEKMGTFERLITEKKLGYMALLRNLRNMQQSGVSKELVANALIEGAKNSKALPFRYIAAARAVPAWEDVIDKAMIESMASMSKMSGETVILVDVSGSMGEKLSSKSDLRRIDAACALAILVRGISDNVRIFTFSNAVAEVPPRNGMALADAIIRSQPNVSTYLGQAVHAINQLNYDRLIVITDEQSHDSVGAPKGKGYMINVACNRNGVGYGQWNKIDGFSESIISYIQELEQLTINL